MTLVSPRADSPSIALEVRCGRQRAVTPDSWRLQWAVPPREARYLVTRPHPGSGIGSNLVSLAGAIWFGEQTGRTVVVDWRGSAFLKDQTANYFTEFFETPSAIQGVPVIYAPTSEFPDGAAEATELDIAAARLALQQHSDDPALLIRSYHGLERLDPKGKPSDHFWRLKDFYRYITPRAFVLDEIERFADA